jgi:hypothetical protein
MTKFPVNYNNWGRGCPVKHWRALRAGIPEVRHPMDPRQGPSDLRAIARELYDDDMTDDAVREAVGYWRNETSLLLEEPKIWAGITLVADELLRRRRLSPRAVEELLGRDTYLFRRFRPPPDLP